MTQPTPCPSRYASTKGATAGAVLACQRLGEHRVHSNMPDACPICDRMHKVTWLSGDDNELIVPCDWCRKPGATHTASEHPLPKTHPDYDAFYDATDDELAGVLIDALRDSDEPHRYTRRNP